MENEMVTVARKALAGIQVAYCEHGGTGSDFTAVGAFLQDELIRLTGNGDSIGAPPLCVEQWNRGRGIHA